MNEHDEPLIAVPQPDGSWLLQTPTRLRRQGAVTVGEGGRIVARIYHEADKERIVEAIFCHAKLVAALRDLVRDNDDYGGCPRSSPAWNAARTALAEAGRSQP